jgi:peroxiredoxin family protein
VQQIEETIETLKAQVETLQKRSTENKLAMVVFSGDLDKLLASLVIATGAVAMGMDAVLFFTFWATPALRDKNKSLGGKDMMGKVFGAMLPKGPNDVQLSKMNMTGLGTAMMKSLMKKKNIASLKEMLELAEELGVRIVICEMSMDLMGLKHEEIIPYKHLEFGGVAKFLEEASSSKIQLFI